MPHGFSRIGRTTATLALLLGLSSTVRAFQPSGPQPPTPPASDRQFVIDYATDLDVYECADRTFVINLPVDRYIGPTKADGTLRDVEALIEAGMISPWAELEMPAYDIDMDSEVKPPELNRVYFNDVPVRVLSAMNNEYLEGADDTRRRNKFLIPIREIKFPSAPGVDGEKPEAALNKVSIELDTLHADWCASVGWVKLRIGAMSPTILLHGNSNSGTWWTTHGFTFAYGDPPMPFGMVDFPLATTGKRNNRRTVDSSYLLVRIPEMAAEFGADSVHLVAHSKGGLAAREFLGDPRRREPPPKSCRSSP